MPRPNLGGGDLGQDVCYSSDQDFSALQAKAQSVYELGVRFFATTTSPAP